VQIFRCVAEDYLVKKPIKLGDPRERVEIDETVSVKRKYNVGKLKMSVKLKELRQKLLEEYIGVVRSVSSVKKIHQNRHFSLVFDEIFLRIGNRHSRIG
jgi:hypothetical protein